ncbi:site-specific DNA-methyltransferase [Micrococcus lylae]|uniref:site-specific DNA-methyltransferase n=1 Tax=Micrococcus lylae TaxID=1273 RepID=UPI0021A35CBC|nr:DNA methyltransferase [Micrococcus lylae]MCT2008384.1 site-specific DNA-methyltransferase [Micrococcus lylae]
MSHLSDLLRQARSENPALGAELERAFRELTQRRRFGLVFEHHRPEAVELPNRPVRKGDKVHILPPRGETKKGDQTLWRVMAIRKGDDGVRVASLAQVKGDEQAEAAVDDLVVVAEFRDHMYPGLVETGRVERGGADKPFHTVINAENFHALEMLSYTHRHKVDCIYIDPPYNTGAKDWKYNNDYVESDDDYRHSKWLSFMERRLQVARELLNPEDSVLIVTIDEKEYLRLGMLLDQTFPDARVQMVSSVIKPGGVSRKGYFGRSDEYIYFVMQGESAPMAEYLREGFGFKATKDTASEKDPLYWNTLWRSGSNALRGDRPDLFYPIYLDREGRVISAGPPLPPGLSRESVSCDDPSLTQVWPLRKDGAEGRWQLGPETLQERAKNGYVRIGKMNGESTRIYNLSSGEIKKIESGLISIVGYRSDGSIVGAPNAQGRRMVPTSQWAVESHDATRHGTIMLGTMMPDRRFPFPKSLYAVEDALRFFVKEKPDAVVLDFFSGSGTTAHAVMRLNKQDGGRRQCISVTNNEVSADEQKGLRKEGLRPGDPEWEQWGICDYITKPRVTTAITGKTPAGDPIKGDYKFIDEFPMADGFEENAAFFTLTYESPLMIRQDLAFERIAPLLWMRAGSRGRLIMEVPAQGWDVAEAYGVLTKVDRAAAFAEAVAESGVGTVYVVTDDERRYQAVCALLPEDVTPVRLYESYLTNFEINTGGRTGA